MHGKIVQITVYTISVLILSVYFTHSYAKDRGTALFNEANQLFSNLAQDPKKSRKKETWETVAQAFFSVYESYPQSKKAPDSLFLSGKMYEEIGNKFSSRSSHKKSISLSRQFIKAFPYNHLVDDAYIRIARVYEKLGNRSQAYAEYRNVIEKTPRGDMAVIARKKARDLAAYKPGKYKNVPKKGSTAKLTKIRHWSTDNSTRVVLHLNKSASYTSRLLKADPGIGKPPRLFVDINNTYVDDDLHVEPLTRGLLEDIKYAQNTKDKSRVVLYIDSFENYNVFSLPDPFRIVMDIWGSKGKVATRSGSKRSVPGNKKTRPGPSDKEFDSLRQALGLKIRTIVIDPGHGGHDPGAVGPNGVKEKDINLKIAKELKKILDSRGKEIGVEKVYLTRSSDRFIPLEERTAIAKKLGADLFISIHCNASRNRKATGSETYILSFTNDKRALEVAARENATTTKRLSDLDDILKKYLLSSKIEESEKFASHVQKSIYENIAPRYKFFKNKGVKRAPFIVLIGADIPSILVEASFISNPREEKRLNNSRYRLRIAQGIYEGIKRYSSEIQSADAFDDFDFIAYNEH